jgi:hypothetical protein
MSVYAPSGSGNVHVDTVMGAGGKKKVAAKGGAAKKGGAKKGMGFKAAAASAAKSAGVSPQQGAAIVAAASQKASPKARKANPNLAKVARPGTKKTAGGKFVKKASGGKK